MQLCYLDLTRLGLTFFITDIVVNLQAGTEAFTPHCRRSPQTYLQSNILNGMFLSTFSLNVNHFILIIAMFSLGFHF